jgi:hypothetical protein
VLVGFQRGGGQVPGVAVGLVAERVRDHQVRRGALGERDGMVDGRADQRMGEPRTRPVHADQARRLRRGQSAGGEPGHRRGDQVRAVGDRGEQQGGPGRPGQGGEPGGHDGGQLAGQREGLISPHTPRGRIGRDDLRQLDQGQRVPGCLGEHLLTGPAAWRSRLGVEEPPGFRRAQRRQPQRPGKVPVQIRGRLVPAGGQEQDEPFRFQPPGGEGERIERGGIQPLRVVGDDQQRALLG